MKKIYLDYAASTPVDNEVLKAMRPYFDQQFYNPSSTYLAARSVRQALERARTDIALCLGSRPAEVIFTAGATEANNLAIAGVMRQFPAGEVLASAIEHESVLAPASQFKNRQIPVNRQGLVEIKTLRKMISAKTSLVSIGLVNNELGVIQSLREISALTKKIRAERLAKGNKLPIYLHSDAAQAGNFLDLHVARLGVDLMSLNGGKIYGPKQSGALYIRTGLKLQPLFLGGGQEFGLRSGTENVPANMGLAAALTKAQALRASDVKRLAGLRDFFEKGLKAKVPGIQINGVTKNRTPHIVNVTFAGVDNERLIIQLDEEGVMAAVGSACSAAKDEPSHVLAAIGLTTKQARSTLRLSFGRTTTQADLERTLELLVRFCSLER